MKYILPLFLLVGCIKGPGTSSNFNVGECYFYDGNTEVIIINKMEYGLKIKVKKSADIYYIPYRTFWIKSERVDCL